MRQELANVDIKSYPMVPPDDPDLKEMRLKVKLWHLFFRCNTEFSAAMTQGKIPVDVDVDVRHQDHPPYQQVQALKVLLPLEDTFFGRYCLQLLRV